MTNRPHVSLDSTTLHVADEQLRLESMQGARAGDRRRLFRAARWRPQRRHSRRQSPSRHRIHRRAVTRAHAQVSVVRFGHVAIIRRRPARRPSSRARGARRRDSRVTTDASKPSERITSSVRSIGIVERFIDDETNESHRNERDDDGGETEFGHEHAHVSVATASVFDDASREKSTLHPPSHHVASPSPATTMTTTCSSISQPCETLPERYRGRTRRDGGRRPPTSYDRRTACTHNPRIARAQFIFTRTPSLTTPASLPFPGDSSIRRRRRV